MTAIIPSVNSTSFTLSAKQKSAPTVLDPQPKRAETAPVQLVQPNTVLRGREFTPEKFALEPASRALGQYLSVQNNEKREQLSQLFGLDVYA